MTSEYVKLSDAERIYGARNLLQSRVSILTAMKHLKAYELLRKEELALKIELKTKIEHALHLTDSIIRGLPKSQLIREKDEEEVFPELVKEEHKKKGIEQELNDIKRKLQALG